MSSELKNKVSQDMQDILQKYIGDSVGKNSLDEIKRDIVNYLQDLNIKAMGVREPLVDVESVGPFVTVNFRDKEGKRLETLGDLLQYMDGMDVNKKKNGGS